MKDETADLRDKVWDLSNKLMPMRMPLRAEVEYWYNSLWDSCRNFGVIDLVKKVEDCKSITELEKQLNCDAMPWLNHLIELFYHDSGRFFTELGKNPSILPNQHGVFMPLDKLFVEENIDEIYKDISLIVGIDFRDRLIDNRVNKIYLKGMQKLALTNVFSELLQVRMEGEARIEFYKSLINIRISDNLEQNAFVKLANRLYPDYFAQSSKARHCHRRILSDALKFWREKMCIDFSSCNNINNAVTHYNFQNECEVAKWISEFIICLKNCEEESLLDKYPILPNQNGDFLCRNAIFLDDGSVDNILKDAAMYSNFDIRKQMLYSGISLELPSSRVISLEQVAPRITDYVRNNSKKISVVSFDGWKIFRDTSIWLREYRKDSKVSKCFKELIENIHWFYDDEEISEIMARSEKYDEILKKYNIVNINELTTILAYYSATDNTANETISISKELIAQWGITSEDELKRALSNNVFGSAQIHYSTSDPEIFNYVNKILDRAKNNIINFLYQHEDYSFDKDKLQFIGKTIFRVSKLGYDIYIIARPSDFDQVILYYDTEIDLLDFDKDCELWVDDGVDPIPRKITLGRILKLTGANKIPLRSLKNDN